MRSRLVPETVCPSTTILPSSARSKPASRLTRVVLPHPDGPTTAVNCPGERSRLTDSMTCCQLQSSP